MSRSPTASPRAAGRWRWLRSASRSPRRRRPDVGGRSGRAASGAGLTSSADPTPRMARTGSASAAATTISTAVDGLPVSAPNATWVPNSSRSSSASHGPVVVPMNAWACSVKRCQMRRSSRSGVGRRGRDAQLVEPHALAVQQPQHVVIRAHDSWAGVPSVACGSGAATDRRGRGGRRAAGHAPGRTAPTPGPRWPALNSRSSRWLIRAHPGQERRPRRRVAAGRR